MWYQSMQFCLLLYHWQEKNGFTFLFWVDGSLSYITYKLSVITSTQKAGLLREENRSYIWMQLSRATIEKEMPVMERMILILTMG